MNYINISIDQDKKIVATKWLRAVNSMEYRKSVEKFYELIRSTKAAYWLVDATRLSSPDLNDQKWTAELLAADLGSTSLRKIAVVLPNDLFLEVVAEKIMEEILQQAGNKVSISLFKNADQGLRWITSDQDTEGLFRKNFTKGEE